MSKKEAFESKMDAQLREWNAEIEKLKARADRARADTKIEYYNRIEDLEARRQAARSKLEDMKSSGESAFENLKSGAEKAWKDLGDAMESARSEIS